MQLLVMPVGALHVGESLGWDPGNAQALGKQLQIHVLGISLNWSNWNSCKKANYIN